MTSFATKTKIYSNNKRILGSILSRVWRGLSLARFAFSIMIFIMVVNSLKGCRTCGFILNRRRASSDIEVIQVATASGNTSAVSHMVNSRYAS